MKKPSSFGWIELIYGILLIALGIFSLVKPGIALVSFVILYGLGAVVSGVADIVFYARHESRYGFAPVSSLVGGILNILLGILLMFNVGSGVLAFSILLPLWFIIHCAVRLANSAFIRAVAGKAAQRASLAVNISGLVLGIVLLLLLFVNPFASLYPFVMVIAVYLIGMGAGSICMAFSRWGRR